MSKNFYKAFPESLNQCAYIIDNETGNKLYNTNFKSDMDNLTLHTLEEIVKDFHQKAERAVSIA